MVDWLLAFLSKECFRRIDDLRFSKNLVAPQRAIEFENFINVSSLFNNLSIQYIWILLFILQGIVAQSDTGIYPFVASSHIASRFLRSRSNSTLSFSTSLFAPFSSVGSIAYPSTRF